MIPYSGSVRVCNLHLKNQYLAKAWATLARLCNKFIAMPSQDIIIATLKSIVDDGHVTISLRNHASVAEPLIFEQPTLLIELMRIPSSLIASNNQ